MLFTAEYAEIAEDSGIRTGVKMGKFRFLGALCVLGCNNDFSRLSGENNLLAGGAGSRLEILVFRVPLRHHFAAIRAAVTVVVGARAVVETGLQVHPHAPARITLHPFSSSGRRIKPGLD